MSGHIDSTRTYYLVFAALIVLTVLTTAVAFLDLGPFNAVVALVIAFAKMMLVVLFFMHMRYGTALAKLMVGGGLLWLMILITFSLSDYISRGWLPVPGRSP
jgi:cytochrome c oxidase subunit 4